MSYDDYEEVGEGFRMSGVDEDEPLDMPDVPDVNDFGLDEEDPDRDS